MTFRFPTGATASRYDEWSHYRNQFQSTCGGSKAVDLVYLDNGVAWLIEVKDYRHNARTKAIDLAQEIAFKVRDSLAGLVSASCKANDPDEKDCATHLLRASSFRVVVHLEQPRKTSRLRPRAFDPSQLVLKLKTLLKAVDAHPRVVDRQSLQADMRWTVV